MRFLRTASTGRLLGVIAGLIVAVGGGTAIAVAATSGGPVPKARPLAVAAHAALAAKPVGGVFAHITFTNGLISSSDFTGDARDPLLQGATGRIWIADDGRLRLELQTTNGDAQVMVNKGSFWISDPRMQTVYEGTLPSSSPGTSGSTSGGTSHSDAVPTIAQLQADINRLMGHVDLGGAQTSDPTDVAGRPAYSVVVSPKHSGGLLGQAKLAWDALTGVPLDIAVYARGNANPVLELKAHDIKYGAGAVAGAFDITPPGNYRVVKVATGGAGGNPTAPMGAQRKAKPITGLADVQSHVAFTLAAPATLVGLPRHAVRLLDWGGTPTAMITYGQNLGGIVVLEHRDSQTTTGAGKSNAQGGGHGPGLALPSVNIHGATGTELSTPLGTVLSYSPAKSGVSYTILGSVPAAAAEAAARALTP